MGGIGRFGRVDEKNRLTEKGIGSLVGYPGEQRYPKWKQRGARGCPKDATQTGTIHLGKLRRAQVNAYRALPTCTRP